MHRSACVLTGHPASREAEGRSGGHAIASGILITFHAKPPVSPPYARVSAIRYLSRRGGGRPPPPPRCVRGSRHQCHPQHGRYARRTTYVQPERPLVDTRGL